MLRRSVSAALTLGLAGLGLTAAYHAPRPRGQPDRAQGSHERRRRAVVLGDQTELLVEPERHLLAADRSPRGAPTLLLRHDDRRRRLGARRPWSPAGWKWQEVGQGTAAVLRTTITGPNAFAPSALSQQVVEGLLAGGRPDVLPDGVRVVRGTNTTGTTWQEVRWHLTNTAEWSWEFAGGEPLASTHLRRAERDQRGLRVHDVEQRVRQRLEPRHARYRQPELQETTGFAYGTQITGSTSASVDSWPA